MPLFCCQSLCRLGPRRVCALHPWGAVCQRPHHGAHHPAVRPAWEIHQGTDTKTADRTNPVTHFEVTVISLKNVIRVRGSVSKLTLQKHSQVPQRTVLTWLWTNWLTDWTICFFLLQWWKCTQKYPLLEMISHQRPGFKYQHFPAVLPVDAEKAFRGLEKDYLWMAFEQFGFGFELIILTEVLYCNPSAVIVTGNNTSTQSPMSRSCLQCCSFSQLL